MKNGMKRITALILALILMSGTIPVMAGKNDDLRLPEQSEKDGYDLWLRYPLIDDEDYRADVGRVLGYVIEPDEDEQIVIKTAFQELRNSLGSFTGESIRTGSEEEEYNLIIGTPESERVAALIGGGELAELAPEGYLIRTAAEDGKAFTVIAGGGPNGVLYGVFKLMEMVQCGEDIEQIDYQDAPQIRWRVLQQWDNWNRSIERGYAGQSIYKWSEMPQTMDSRYRDFARANASIGINTIVINNVNAQKEYIMTENLPKVAALADIFREYGIRLSLTVRFDSPQAIGKLATNDPLDPEVIAWWEEKFAEIYEWIPDFAGVLVKADSEGQPGPSSYDRTHADGANMFSEILKAHGDGVVMWRAFVYGPKANTYSDSRVNQAYEFFKPLDGQFHDNVIIQSKNGPWDFLTREPVSPLFGGMTETNMGIEFQITQEYTGQSTHLCYLTPMWKSYFDFDTKVTEEEHGAYTDEGTELHKIIDGTVFNNKDHTLVAGVANVGSDRNWTRLELAQANWYAFGRLAWNPQMAEPDITDTWTKMTFSCDEEVVETVGGVLRDSWEVYEAYTAPRAMGMAVTSKDTNGNPSHFDPDPVMRNRSGNIEIDSVGIGTNRTVTSGGYKTDSTAQYSQAVGEMFGDIETCPEEYLFWFHHVPYDHIMENGKTMIEDLYDGYAAGPGKVREMAERFNSLDGLIDNARLTRIADRFERQYKNARVWTGTMTNFIYEQSGLKMSGAMELPGKFQAEAYAPEGTAVEDGAVLLQEGERVTFKASITAGTYLTTLHGTGTEAEVRVEIGGADAGIITMEGGKTSWSSGAVETVITDGSIADAVTLTVLSGSVRLTALEFTASNPVSIGTAVTSSTSESGNPEGNIVNGNKTSRWAASSKNFPQWVKIDLGDVYDIGYYHLLWYNQTSRSYKYNIWVSDSDEGDDKWVNNQNTGAYQKVVDNTMNTSTDANGNTHSADGDGYQARYIVVDVVGSSTGTASLYFVDVYGWQVDSEVYVVDKNARSIAGIKEGTTAGALLDGMTVRGNGKITVVDGSGAPAGDQAVLAGEHKLKVMCSEGSAATFYDLEFGEIVPLEVIQAETLADKEVPLNVSVDSLNLPKKINVTLDDETSRELPVVWDTSGYNSAKTGVYHLKGELTLPANGVIVNSAGHMAEVKVTVIDKYESGGKDSFNKIDLSNPVGTDDNTAVFEFDVVPNVDAADVSVMFSRSGANKMADHHIQIRMRSTNVIDARNGGEFAAVETIPYQAGQRYHIKIVSDTAANTFDAWVTSPDGEEAILAADYGYRSDTALSNGFEQMTLAAASSPSAGRITVYNFKAYDLPADIVLEKYETTMAAGSKETLTATVLPAATALQDVIWNTSNPAVALVENGVIQAVSEGKAVITATTADGSRTAKCTVTVNKAAVPVMTVTLNKTEMILTAGESEKLQAAIAPANATNKKMLWSSDRNTVATVGADGKVTAVAAGTAKITVKTEDGGKTAVCTVTVNPQAEREIDTTALKRRLLEAQTLSADISYTAASRNLLKIVLKEIEAKIDNYQTQEEVDADVNELKNAIEALVKVPNSGRNSNGVKTVKNIPDQTTSLSPYPSSAGNPSGWIKDETGWWLKTGDNTYAKAEWKLVDNVWYFFNESGYMQTGWIQLNNQSFYLNENGSMAVGWRMLGDKWYYFGADGVLVRKQTTPDGYYVNEDGVWVK